MVVDIASSSGYDREYIEKINSLLFRPIKDSRASDSMNLDEFERVFEGKLGNATVIRTFFNWFDTDKKGALDLQHFCQGLAKLEKGPEEEKLRGNKRARFTFCHLLSVHRRSTICPFFISPIYT
jgi:Ca2+-binding EF-hand superfamily protein